jgi:hypothetical protein
MIDFSTLDANAMRKLEIAKLAPSYRVSDQMGSACYGDPPGYPSYFIQHVYTRHGNTPRRGPERVIKFEGVYRVITSQTNLRALWCAPAYDSPRVRAWICDTYRHLRNCYHDALGEVSDPSDNKLVIFPVPNYKLRRFSSDPRLSEAWNAHEREMVALYNQELTAKYEKVAIPANHRAYRNVVTFYPQHVPDLALIADPSGAPIVHWYETSASQPTPEECTPRGFAHPVNKTWCQRCGWKESAE